MPTETVSAQFSFVFSHSRIKHKFQLWSAVFILKYYLLDLFFSFCSQFSSIIIATQRNKAEHLFKPSKSCELFTWMQLFLNAFHYLLYTLHAYVPIWAKKNYCRTEVCLFWMCSWYDCLIPDRYFGGILKLSSSPSSTALFPHLSKVHFSRPIFAVLICSWGACMHTSAYKKLSEMENNCQ